MLCQKMRSLHEDTVNHFHSWRFKVVQVVQLTHDTSYAANTSFAFLLSLSLLPFTLSSAALYFYSQNRSLSTSFFLFYRIVHAFLLLFYFLTICAPSIDFFPAILSLFQAHAVQKVTLKRDNCTANHTCNKLD